MSMVCVAVEVNPGFKISAMYPWHARQMSALDLSGPVHD